MLGSFVTFNFDTTKGPINIYVSGPVFFQDADMKLNGVSFGSIAPSDASQVYWETHDNFHAEFSNLLGTIYAPFGDIQSVKLSQSKGELIAGIDLITDGGTYTAGAASQSLLVPEPAAMTLIIAATASAAIPALLRRRRARGRVRRCVS
jgi:hypothetical protein